MSYVVTAVHPLFIPVLWGQVKSFLDDAIDYSNGEKSIDVVYSDLLQSNATLVIVYREQTMYGAAVLYKRVFETGKSSLLISLLGGVNMPEWIQHAYTVAKIIAKEHGCSNIYCLGRSGWEKILKSIGFNKAYSVMTIDVEV